MLARKTELQARAALRRRADAVIERTPRAAAAIQQQSHGRALDNIDFRTEAHLMASMLTH